MLYTERAHFYHRYKVPPIFYLININAVSFGLKALVSLCLNPPVKRGSSSYALRLQELFQDRNKSEQLDAS
jgi:hypothetical protein